MIAALGQGQTMSLDTKGGDGGGFGLGVGFALSPELAQKVRDCRGVGTAPPVAPSSLTFLKGAGPIPPSNGPITGSIDSCVTDVKSVHGQRSNGSVVNSVLGEDVMKRNSGDGPSGPLSSDAGRLSSERCSVVDGESNAAGQKTMNGEGNSNNDRTVAANDQTLQLPGISPVELDGAGEQGNLEEALEDGFVGTGVKKSLQNSAPAGSDRRGHYDLRAEHDGISDGNSKFFPKLAIQRIKGEDNQHRTTETDHMEGATDDAPDNWEDLDDDDDNTSASLAALSASTRPPIDVNFCSMRKASNDSTGEETPKSVADALAADTRSHSHGLSGGEFTEVTDDQNGVSIDVTVVHKVQSLPVLMVDLARVCGFRVRGAEEAEAVGAKIRAALHESFRERSEELFEMGSAVHTDTLSLEEELSLRQEIASKFSWAVVEYPANVDGVSVEEAWRFLATPSPCAAVEAARRALVGTNRHLVWKREMLEQLKEVAAKERQLKEARGLQEKSRELEGWRARRREQLERLIEVRPMFERRRAMAEEKLLMAQASSASAWSNTTGEVGGDGTVSDPVSAAVVSSLDAKLESIDDLIARLEIEEGEDGYGFVPSDEEEEDDYEYEFDYEFLEDLQGVRPQPEDQRPDAGDSRHSTGTVGRGDTATDNGKLQSESSKGAQTVTEDDKSGVNHAAERAHAHAETKGRSSTSTGHGNDQATKGLNSNDQRIDRAGKEPTLSLRPNGGLNGGLAKNGRRTVASASKTVVKSAAKLETEPSHSDDTVEGASEAESSTTVRSNTNCSSKRKKKGKKSVVEQLRDRGSCTDNDSALANADDGDNVRVEEGEGGGSPSRETKGGANDESPPVMSLIDAVAAMILGRYPQDPRMTAEQHFAKIASMHQHMKADPTGPSSRNSSFKASPASASDPHQPDVNAIGAEMHRGSRVEEECRSMSHRRKTYRSEGSSEDEDRSCTMGGPAYVRGNGWQSNDTSSLVDQTDGSPSRVSNHVDAPPNPRVSGIPKATAGSD